MKKLLEDLWYSYLMENRVERDSEEMKILDTLIENEEKLRADLNDEQKLTFTRYESCVDDINGIAEKRAFVRGLRFGVRFMIETLCGE